MSADKVRRIVDAIAECDRVLEKASSYMERNQDRDLIAKYEAHKIKLQGMLS